MKSILYVIFLLPFFCISQQTLNKTITHDGMTRDYIVHIPSSYDGNSDVPLLLCYHGYTSSANTLMNYSGFNAKSDQNNFIVAYPQGTLLDGSTHWNVGGWTLASTVDDVDFTDKLLDTIMNDYTIDVSRVYSTGMSNGGYMSFLLACQLSDRIAAIASVTGSMTPQTYNACNPTHPTPVLQIHGTSDGTVPYNGSSTWTKSINDVLNYWQANNNCDSAPVTTDIEDTNTSDGSTVEKITYTTCDDCSRVEHYKVTGGDHDWPGVWGNMDIAATDTVWAFLEKYDINGLMTCGTLSSNEIENSTKLNYYKSGAELFVTGLINETTKYHIFNLEGKNVSQGLLSKYSNKVNTSSFSKGLYLLKIDRQTIKFIIE